VRIPRIYQPIPLICGQTVECDAQATVYLTKVLRLKTGADLVVFNGEGGEFRARVGAVGRRSASIDIGEFVQRETESPLELTLLQGVSRGERMDYTVQKAVELGVAHITPVVTERTVVNLKGDRLVKRRDHWQAIVNSACEQSGRNRVPIVAAIQPFTAVMKESAQTLAEDKHALTLVLHHRAEASLDDLPIPQGPVSLLIGPEGGLSDGEIATAEAAGFVPVKLGPRVLRTETAALVALSVLQWLWGDLAVSDAAALSVRE